MDLRSDNVYARQSYDVQFSEVINKNMQLPETIMVTSLMNNSALRKSDKDDIIIEELENFSELNLPYEFSETIEQEPELESVRKDRQAQLSPGYSPSILTNRDIPESKPKVQKYINHYLADIDKRIDRIETRLDAMSKIGSYVGGFLAVYFSLKFLNFLVFRRTNS